jgi:nicotinamidase-related amidase
LIDVINDFDFEGGAILARAARAMAPRVAALKARTRRFSIPAIYVNDNFGRWRSDFRQLVRHCGGPHSRGRSVAASLRPLSDDYFILKPKHSAFFATALDTLLRYLDVRTLILVGLTTDNCVLFTASDAYLRDFHLHVPRDCVAAIEARQGRQALQHLERVLRADTRPSGQLDLAAMLRAGDPPAREVPSAARASTRIPSAATPARSRPFAVASRLKK